MPKKLYANRKSVQHSARRHCVKADTKSGSGKKQRKKNRCDEPHQTSNIVKLNHFVPESDTSEPTKRNRRQDGYRSGSVTTATKVAPFKARNKSQQDYIDAIASHCLTFGMGPAGTGKSYCACAMAVKAYEAGRVDRIVLTRPAVEAGEQLGFLPGDIEEKFAVYVEAFRDILAERLGPGTVDFCLREGHIQVAPLAYMRGKTFNERTFVILEEAQNTSPAQMKMFLSRIGENCKVVCNGDVAQSDIRGRNGLQDALSRLENLDNVAIHQFTHNDIVRSGLVKDIIARYEETPQGES